MAFSKFQGKSSYMFTPFIFRDSQQLYQAWHSWTMISPGSVFWAGLSAQGSRFSEGREQHITTLHRSLWSLSASAYLRGSWHWATALLSSSSHCSSKNLLLLPHRWAGVKQWQNQALNTTCCPGTSAKMNNKAWREPEKMQHWEFPLSIEFLVCFVSKNVRSETVTLLSVLPPCPQNSWG